MLAYTAPPLVGAGITRVLAAIHHKSCYRLVHVHVLVVLCLGYTRPPPVQVMHDIMLAPPSYLLRTCERQAGTPIVACRPS